MHRLEARILVRKDCYESIIVGVGVSSPSVLGIEHMVLIMSHQSTKKKKTCASKVELVEDLVYIAVLTAGDEPVVCQCSTCVDSRRMTLFISDQA